MSACWACARHHAPLLGTGHARDPSDFDSMFPILLSLACRTALFEAIHLFMLIWSDVITQPFLHAPEPCMEAVRFLLTCDHHFLIFSQLRTRLD
jgi:hypothetical protein